MREWAAIFGGSGAALITGVFAVLINRFRRENTRQHNETNALRAVGHATNLAKMEDIAERITEVRDDVKEVRDDVRHVHRRQNDHLEWHAEKKSDE
tara:strand:- start:422 stop:709 length:288 start_codon:yes stop_codon:yes gene_type:complete